MLIKTVFNVAKQAKNGKTTFQNSNLNITINRFKKYPAYCERTYIIRLITENE